MQSLIRWIVLSAGWPRRFAAMTAGACGALALAPVDFAPAMIVPMTVAVWLIDGAARGERAGWAARLIQPRSCRAAAAIGWWWGFGYFIAGLWWLGAAFLVEPSKDAWALPFGVLGVPALLALFPALGFALARLCWSTGPWRVFALTAGLGVFEWLRAHLFTGFPWNNYGMAFGDVLPLAQAASLVGNDGLTLLAVAIGAAPATLADPGRGRPGLAARVAPISLAAAAVVALAAFGVARLGHDAGAIVPGVRLRIVQPDVPQDDTFAYANRDKIVANYLELSDRATSPERSGLADVTHLVWPESAFPFILAREPDMLETIGKALPAGTLLLTGAARLETSGSSGNPRYFNSVEVVGSGGVLLGAYDKVHLVPFGEYLPFDRLLRSLGLTHFVHVPGGFTAGPQHRVLDIPGLPPVVPLICYEAIFSDEALPSNPSADRARAGLFLNVTNDGWFGQTSGPYQHLAHARLRSIEYGLPMIRAANSGISAVIDPYGRITASLELGARNVLDAALPARIPTTRFSRSSSMIKLAVYGLAVLFAMVSRCLRRTG